MQAYEDSSRAEGGHAAILLRDVPGVPSPFYFRIRPLDAARSGDRNGGWIGGSHTPVASRSTDQGFELIAGPAITENEQLLPGTVVEIEVPAGGVRGEFLWPNIAPLMRPRRKSIVVARQRHAAKIEPAATAASAALPRPARPKKSPAL